PSSSSTSTSTTSLYFGTQQLLLFFVYNGYYTAGTHSPTNTLINTGLLNLKI
ncbi:unnamed protein product, partial [Rotaria sordida]